MKTIAALVTMAAVAAPAEPDPREAASAIRAALTRGLREAADAYRAYVDAGGNVVELRREAQLSAQMWSALEGIANGDDPWLYVVSEPVRVHLRLVPHATLQKLVKDGVPVMDQHGNMRRIKLSEIGPNQVAVALDGPRLRTPEEQFKYLQKRAEMRALENRPLKPFEVFADKVTFNTHRGAFTVPWSMIVEAWKAHEEQF